MAVFFCEYDIYIKIIEMFDEARRNRRGMSYPKRPRRTKSTCASSPSDGANVIRNIETTIQRLEQLAEKYKGVNDVDGFLSDLWFALGIQNQGGLKKGGKPSRYALYQMQDGTMLLISIRASGHNANADKYICHPPVPDKNLSIVLQKKMRKSQFKPNPNVNLGEYVYVNQKIRDVENPLSKIAYSLIGYLGTGKYEDLTGVAIQHGNINENINYSRNMKKNRIRLTESQLHRVIKESVKRVLREGKVVNNIPWKTSDQFKRGFEAYEKDMQNRQDFRDKILKREIRTSDEVNNALNALDNSPEKKMSDAWVEANGKHSDRADRRYTERKRKPSADLIDFKKKWIKKLGDEWYNLSYLEKLDELWFAEDAYYNNAFYDPEEYRHCYNMGDFDEY